MKTSHGIWWGFGALLFALPAFLSCQNVIEQPARAADPPKRDASDDFFETGPIPTIKLILTNEEMQHLRQDGRRYTTCVLMEGATTKYEKVSVKLKGAAGSFRGFDDRPALTLNVSRYKKNQRFHGMSKFHLNNSVQDPSYICEALCSQLCREAGQPVARVSHARVYINDRDMGIYVLKEGLDDFFLSRNFSDAKGNLYDGGFCIDIDQPLEKDEGGPAEDRTDLQALVAACREGDGAKRAALVAERLDVDAFLNFAACELMMCHWDGYLQNKNNYRVYFHPQTKKAHFIPHGMDQMFGDVNFSVFHQPGQIVGSAVFQNAEWRGKFRERVKQLLPLFEPEKMNARIDAIHARVRPAFAAIHEDRAKEFDQRAKEMKDRVAHRAEAIRTQMRNAPPLPPVFPASGFVMVDEWYAGPNPGDSKLEMVTVENKPLISIFVGASNLSNASWRRKMLLARGTYRLEARGRVTNVAAAPDEMQVGKGLGMRVSGGKRITGLVGTTQWEPMTFDFEIPDEQRELELVIELRATSGRAWVDPSTIKLVKVK